MLIVTLSLVIVVWLGTSMNCSRRLTLRGRSTTGMRNTRPGPLTSDSSVLPSRKTTSWSSRFTTRIDSHRMTRIRTTAMMHREQERQVQTSTSPFRAGGSGRWRPAVRPGSTMSRRPSRPTTRTGVPGGDRSHRPPSGPSIPRRQRRPTPIGQQRRPHEAHRPGTDDRRRSRSMQRVAHPPSPADDHEEHERHVRARQAGHDRDDGRVDRDAGAVGSPGSV